MSFKIVALVFFGAALIAIAASSSNRNKVYLNGHEESHRSKEHTDGFLEKINKASERLSEDDKKKFDVLKSEYVELRKKVLGEIEVARKNFMEKLTEAKKVGWEQIVEVKKNEGATLRQKSDEGYGKLHESERKIWKFFDDVKTQDKN